MNHFRSFGKPPFYGCLKDQTHIGYSRTCCMCRERVKIEFAECEVWVNDAFLRRGNYDADLFCGEDAVGS